jgi:aspartate racemase
VIQNSNKNAIEFTPGNKMNMKTIGLIGGTSWASTVDYYRAINQLTNKRLGGLHSAKLFLYSLDLDEFITNLDANDWDKIANDLTFFARKLEAAGANCIVMCANTPHVVANIVQSKINIPIIHIADATAQGVTEKKIKTVSLLGTKFTMENGFFQERLINLGIETLIPNEGDREFIHKTIFAELEKGIFTGQTKERYLSIIDEMTQRGAKGVIFGCTEISMIIKPEDCKIETFDTAIIHAKAAVDFALGSI